MSLLDLELKWVDSKGIEVKDEEKEKLKSLCFESDYFVGMCYSDQEEMTLSRQKVWITTERKLVGKVKPIMKFFIIKNIWIEKYGVDILSNEWDFKDIKSLEDCVNDEKEELNYSIEQLKENKIFDNHRYWWKFDYNNGVVQLIEKL